MCYNNATAAGVYSLSQNNGNGVKLRSFLPVPVASPNWAKDLSPLWGRKSASNRSIQSTKGRQQNIVGMGNAASYSAQPYEGQKEQHSNTPTCCV
jgi:hypothetical protein